MKSKRIRSLLASLLTTCMLFTSSISAFASPATDNSGELDKIIQGVEQLLKFKRKSDGQKFKELKGVYGGENEEQIINKYAPDDEVRIIVELKGSPVQNINQDKQKLKDIQISQEKVKNDIRTQGMVGEFRHNFFIGVNAFSMDTEYKNLEKIRNLTEVANVRIARVYAPAMASSKGMVQAQKAWEELGLQGEGMVVAVVDSGVDYNHQDMKLTEEGQENAKLTQENLSDKLAETEVEDVYYTEKVPTGYDWADNDNDVMPYNNSHGMHVSGTIGAYGDEENDGVTGIAPGVQILAEKVFSDLGGGAYEDDIIAGINHAVKMEADVINMSLGSPSGIVDEEYDAIQKAIRNATEQGVLVVVAGGNDYYSTKSNHPYPSSWLPHADNPDIGIVGDPGVSPYALEVASYENDQFRVNSMNLSSGEEIGYKRQNTKDIVTELGQDIEYELVYVNEGRNEDYEGKDVEGKVVVLSLENIYYSYGSFQSWAKNNGAVAVIVRPFIEMDDYPVLWFSSYSIPAVTTSYENASKLIEKLENGEKLTISFNNNGLWVDNSDKGEMSDFSSWGAPHTLDFKPEITAPGGDIYSTVFDNKYDVYSGTSMATPHVAGAAALVLQALKEKGEEQDINSVLKAKTMLMNTSKVLYDNNIPYSPRRQGAGFMQINEAIETPALVYSKDVSQENAASVALKEIKEDNVQFNLTLEALNGNSVPESISYDVYIDLLTDETEIRKYEEYDFVKDEVEHLTLNSIRVDGAEIKVNGEIITHNTSSIVEVKKGEKVDLEFEIDLSKATNLKDNMFVEGFIRLVPSESNENSDIPELTVPYMGFYGEWDDPKNIDEPACFEDNRFLAYTALWDYVSETPIGFDVQTQRFDIEKIAVSPKGMTPGPYVSFTVLRNLKEVELYVEDEEGNRIKYIGNFDIFTGEPWRFKKNIIPYGDYSISTDWLYTWEMNNEEGNIVPDGRYNYVIKSTLDYEGAEPQFTKMPIKVDSIAPEISNIEINQLEDGRYEITWESVDNEEGAGYKGSILYIDGRYNFTEYGEKSYIVDEEPEGIVIGAYDYAYNLRYGVYGNPKLDSEILIPWINVNGDNVSFRNPAKITAFANNKLDWTITIKDPEGNVLDTRFIENQDALYGEEWYPEKGMTDGEYSVIIEAVDKYGFEVTAEPEILNVTNQEKLYIGFKSKPDSVKIGRNAMVRISAYNNAVQNKSVTLILALYDENNHLLDYVSRSELVESGTIKSLFKYIKVSSETYKVKCFVWDDFNNIEPLIESLEIPIEE